MTEKVIIDRLIATYLPNVSFWNNNFYFYDWESDFWILSKTGYATEFEIKITVSDFKADFKKKNRHSILPTGIYRQRKYSRPHRFYYVVPKGMIGVDQIPEYAGLMYFDGFGFTKIKSAPILHKNMEIDYKYLAKKFFSKMLDFRYALKINKLNL